MYLPKFAAPLSITSQDGREFCVLRVLVFELGDNGLPLRGGPPDLLARRFHETLGIGGPALALKSSGDFDLATMAQADVAGKLALHTGLRREDLTRLPLSAITKQHLIIPTGKAVAATQP